jgi:anthranilate phosphoribosyltransferase
MARDTRTAGFGFGSKADRFSMGRISDVLAAVGTSIAAHGNRGTRGMTTIGRRAVVERLRSLMTAPLEQVARGLQVSEAALRAAVHGAWARPTVEVIVAASVYYGVDPAWIMAGSYDADALRAAAEGDVAATTASVLKMMRSAEVDVVYDEHAAHPTRTFADEAVAEFSRPNRNGITADQRTPSPPQRDEAGDSVATSRIHGTS